MLGDNIRSAGWPNCGEIDIMEHVGREPFKVFGTLHGPGYSGASGISATHTLSTKVSNDFHTFAIEWEPKRIRFYIDRVLYKTRTDAWVFDHPFFLILNVAVGGSFPGNPDGTTVFPQSMQVDYVRVYRRARS
jgi:beta-glucanase (GH16 family)